MDKNTAAGLQLNISAPRRGLLQDFSAFFLSVLLFFSLALVFCGVTGLRLSALPLAAGGIILTGSAAAGGKKRAQLIFLCACMLISALAAFICAPAREGIKLLCNRLFDMSEAVNSYAYERFAVSDAANSDAARTALAVFAAACCALAVQRKSRAIVLLLFLAAAGAEVYFGVMPDAWQNLLLFAALGLALVQGGHMEPRLTAVLLAMALIVGGAVFAAAPGVNAGLETYSEQLRDRLDVIEHRTSSAAVQTMEDILATRKENRLDEQTANGVSGEQQNMQSYTLNQEYEDEVAQPERTDYKKIILLSLLIPALLLMPFMPFALLDARRRRAAAKRADFESDDCSAAVRAMFLHETAWLKAAGLNVGNRFYSDCTGEVEALTDASCAGDYARAVALWQEAAYSGHAMTGEQRSEMRAILERTENLLYGRAKRTERFKLKYIDCLKGAAQ